MSDYSDIVNSYKDMSVSELGGSLLQRKGEIAEKQRKRAKKDMRIQQALGVLLAGQGLMKNAFKRRQKELANQQTLDLLTAESDAKQIQNLSTIYNYTPVGYNSLEEFTKEINPKTGKVYTVQENSDRFFLNRDNNQGFKSKISPLIDQQLKFSDQETMKIDNNRAYRIVQENAARSLFEQMITDDNHIKYLNGLEKFFNDDGLSREDVLKESFKLDKGRYSQYLRQKYAKKEAEFSNQGMLSAFGGFIKSLGDDQEAKGNLNLFKKLKPEDLQTPELRKVLDSLNVRGIVLEAVDKGLQSARQSPQSYLNMVNNKKYEPLRNNMTDIVLLDLARDVDNNRVFETYGLQSYIDDSVFEALQKDIGKDASVKIKFQKRAAALSLRLLEDKQFALQLIKDAGAAGAGFRSEQASNFIKQLENDEFRNKFAVLAVLQAGAYDPGFFSGYKFQGAIDPLSGLGMGKPDPQTIKTDMGYSDEQAGDKLDPVLNPMFNLKTGEATQDYVKLGPRGKDNAWYSMALQVLNSSKGTEADKLQALEDLNNTTPNPRNLPVIEYLQVKEEESRTSLGGDQAVQMGQIDNQIQQTTRFINQGGNKIMGTVIEASPKQIEEAKTRLVELENQRRTILASPELRDKGINELQAKVTEFETNRTSLKFNSTPAQFRRLEEEYNKNKKELSSLQTGETENVKLVEEGKVPEILLEPRKVGKDLALNAINLVTGLGENETSEQVQNVRTFLDAVVNNESVYGTHKDTFNNPASNARGPFQIKDGKIGDDKNLIGYYGDVIDVLSRDTGRGKNVRAYNEQLKEKLGIDLSTAQPEDLDKMLYSAAFARAGLMLINPPIPTDPKGQAYYYADYYHRGKDRDKIARAFLLKNKEFYALSSSYIDSLIGGAKSLLSSNN